MKEKTIRKILIKKAEQWLESIDDAVLRQACKEDMIITGGSIPSMLSQQDVNDYDIYFKTRFTTEKIANYYVDKIRKIYINKISDSEIKVINSKHIPDIPEWMNEGDDNAWNHFVKTLNATDEERVKIFIPHIGYWRRDDENSSRDIESVKEDSFQPVYLTENAISLSDDVQLVIRFFGNVKEIHKNYDFVHATSYFHYDKEFNKWVLVLKKDALKSIITKELVYIGSKYPLTSVIRAKKFVLRGYTISAGTYLKILWQVAELDLKDPIVLQEQLIGVDIAYFSTLIKILRDIPPSKLSYGYIAEIIDKVFDGDEKEV